MEVLLGRWSNQASVQISTFKIAIMKTSIVIRGQIFGNFKLRNAIITAECQERKGMFYSHILTFPTKGKAIKALSNAYQNFCREMPEEKNRFSGFKYQRGFSLSWDASRAEIVENN